MHCEQPHSPRCSFGPAKARTSLHSIKYMCALRDALKPAQSTALYDKPHSPTFSYGPAKARKSLFSSPNVCASRNALTWDHALWRLLEARQRRGLPWGAPPLPLVHMPAGCRRRVAQEAEPPVSARLSELLLYGSFPGVTRHGWQLLHRVRSAGGDACSAHRDLGFRVYHPV